MMNKLFTIGHSNRSLGEFLALLEQYGITAICDVRSRPYSSQNPQFNQNTLKEELKTRGISYVFLGQELGGRPESPDCYIGGRASYEKIAKLPSFKTGLERIKEGLKKNYLLALMCAEKDPISCHRAILICRHLCHDALSIHHIINKETIETQEALEQRLLKSLKLHPDFFERPDPRTVIERAYDLQGKHIAYSQEVRMGKENRAGG